MSHTPNHPVSWDVEVAYSAFVEPARAVHAIHEPVGWVEHHVVHHELVHVAHHGVVHEEVHGMVSSVRVRLCWPYYLQDTDSALVVPVEHVAGDSARVAVRGGTEQGTAVRHRVRGQGAHCNIGNAAS